jgi:predicted ATPase
MTPTQGLRAETFRPFLRRIRIVNYRSLGKCDLELRSLSVLVGRNGAGKSNLLDALRFVVDSLEGSLDHAIKARGGIDNVRRRSTGHPRNFGITLDFHLPGWLAASYGFEIAARTAGGFAVKHERLVISSKDGVIAKFERRGAQIEPAEGMPPVLEDRLYLVNAAGRPEFRPAYDALRAMGFYNLNPEVVKELQSSDAGDLLHRDGGNLASVIGRLTAERPEDIERVRSYLRAIVPGITDVERVTLGPRETLLFHQKVQGAEHPWKFYAASMSDGTLRALGALVAVAQVIGAKEPPRLVGIEEPETALHPAAAGALMDALREATPRTQVLVTSHSVDLLNQVDAREDGLFVVESRGGTTYIARADAASREAIESHLFKPGELLQLDQLQPDEEDLERQEQMTLFEEPVEAS